MHKHLFPVDLQPGVLSLKVPITFQARKAVVCIPDQRFNNFENDTMKLSVNEPKLTSLWAWNCATIQQVLMSKFAFWPKKLAAFRETGPTGLKADSLENDMWTLQPFEEGWLFQLFRKETKNALLNTTVQLNTVSDLPWAKVCRFQTFLLLRLREEE